MIELESFRRPPLTLSTEPYMASQISREEFSSLFDTFRNSAFRLETLNQYTVAGESAEFARFRAGEELPQSTDGEWAKRIRKWTGEGKIIRRVHVISTPLTAYLKYEIYWGYVYSSLAGEDIYLIDRSKVPAGVVPSTDFWLFDEKTLILMRYDSVGQFLHAEREDSVEVFQTCCKVRDSLLSSALTLKNFLAQARSF